MAGGPNGLDRSSPYDPDIWIAGHQTLGGGWIPNDALVYPIGLALILAPLGLLPVYQAYVVWVFLSLLMILDSGLLLLAIRRGSAAPIQVVVPIVPGMFFFRPVLVTVRNGQLGSLLLLLVARALWMWERERTSGLRPLSLGLGGAGLPGRPLLYHAIGAVRDRDGYRAGGGDPPEQETGVATRLAVAIAVPAALLLTPYIWAYDQVLLLVPLARCVPEMRDRSFPYLATASLVLLFSLAALALAIVAERVGRDAWSAALSPLAMVGSIFFSKVPAPSRPATG